MKKSFLMSLCAIFLLIPFMTTASAAEDTKSELDLNFIIVMDNSGSLDKNDPGKICVDSAKLFIDLLPMTSTRVGVVIFGNGVKSTINLQNVNSLSTRQGLKYKLKKQMNYSSKLTDIGAGLSKAMSMLKKENKANSAILLFTDGSLRTFANQKSRSRKQVQNAISEANERGWPIYTIGLNADGSADKEMLNNISLNTDAGQTLIAKKAGQMVEYFTDLFKRYMDIDAPMTENVINNGFAEFTITQPEMASETNIVLTGAGIGNIALTDPQGKAVDLKNSKQVYYIREKRYKLLKILQPQPGEWKLHVKGSNGQKIYVQTLNTFDLPLEMKVSAANVKKNETIKFDSYLVYNDTRSRMPSFYNKTPAKVVLVDTETKVKTEHDMKVLEDGYTLSLKMSDGGTFEAYTVVDTLDLKRESDKFTIVVENKPVETVGSMPPVNMKVGKTSTADLSRYFYDPYGDELKYSYDCKDQKLAKFSDAQNMLTITALGKAGTADVTVTADDGDGSSVSQTFSLTAENAPVVVSKRLVDTLMYTGSSIDINLGDLFTDPDGLPLTWEITAEGDIFTYTVKDGALTINAEKDGKARLCIQATDSAGETVSQEADFTSKSAFGYYFALLSPYLVALIVLIILILLFRRARCRVRGIMSISAKHIDANTDMENSFAEYEINPSRSFARGKMLFKMSKLLAYYCGRIAEDGIFYGDPTALISAPVFSSIIFKGAVFGRKTKVVSKTGKSAVAVKVGSNDVKLPVTLRKGQTAVFTVKSDDASIIITINYLG